MSLELNLKQTLKPSVSPQITQSLDILQAAGFELVSLLDEIAAENPFVEIYYPPLPIYRSSQRYLDTPSFDILQRLPSKSASLEELLCGQLRLIRGLSRQMLQIASFIAGCLDERGYMTMSCAEISLHLQQPVSLVEQALDIVQNLEPAGIAATTLQDCLFLQTKRDSAADSLAGSVIRYHLEDLGKMKLLKIAGKLKTTPDRIRNIAKYIRTLNPHPGHAFAVEHEPSLVPDAEIVCRDEAYEIRFALDYFPQIKINPFYLQLAQEQQMDFLKEKLLEAKNLKRSLNHRQKTLHRVIGVMVAEQSDFFKYGPSAIKPMSLKDVAVRLDLHESTISRAIKKKFIQTSQGLIQLKSFFSVGLNTDDGQSVSTKKIQQRLKEMILNHSTGKPLSDQDLAHRLNEEGIRISRRTVAKYRKQMHILSSVYRHDG